jgi:type IV pilus assembly protein PilW
MAMNTHTHTRSPIDHQAGLSLIELLVAIALGGILLGGAISLFVNNRATYEITNEMARLQENARFALQLLGKDIRMAGHVGCVNDVTKVNDNIFANTPPSTPPAADGRLARFTHGIEGFESGAGSWLPSGHTGENGAAAADSGAIIVGNPGLYGAFLADSDGITVRYLRGNRASAALLEADAGNDTFGNPKTGVINEVVNKSPNDASDSNPVLQIRSNTATGAPTFNAVDGQVLAVADCGAVDIFQLNGAPGTVNVNGTTEDTTNVVSVSTFTAQRGSPAIGVGTALKRSYELGNRAVVMPFVGVRYFVRLNSSGNAALHRTTLLIGGLTETTVELVDGVQSMQILYGVDSDQDGAPNAFLSAGQTGVADPLDATKTINLTTRNDYLAVVAVKVSLLLSTTEEHGATPDLKVYDVGNERVCSDGLVADPVCTLTYTADFHRRRVFQTTIAVRNVQ